MNVLLESNSARGPIRFQNSVFNFLIDDEEGFNKLEELLKIEGNANKLLQFFDNTKRPEYDQTLRAVLKLSLTNKFAQKVNYTGKFGKIPMEQSKMIRLLVDYAMEVHGVQESFVIKKLTNWTRSGNTRNSYKRKKCDENDDNNENDENDQF